MIYCNEPDFTTTIKICPICRGDVHLHCVDKDENGFWLLCHCHLCGEYYGSKEWEEMKNYKD